MERKHIAHKLPSSGGCQILLLTLFFCLCGAAAVLADSPNSPPLPSAAEAATAAAREGRLNEAVELWTQALDGVAGQAHWDVHANLAIAWRKLGRVDLAWHYLWRFVQHTRRGRDDALHDLGLLERELESSHVRLRVNCQSDGTVLQQDSNRPLLPGLGNLECPFEGWVRPGEYLLTARHEGNRSMTMQVKAARGQGPLAIEIVLGPAEALPRGALPRAEHLPEQPLSAPVVAAEAKEPSARSWQPWAVVGMGGLLALGGGVTWAIAWDNYRALEASYPDGTPDQPAPPGTDLAYGRAYDRDVAPWKVTSYVLWGTGALALAGGTVWLLLAEDDAPDSGGASQALAPWIGPGVAGWQWSGTF